MEHVSFKDAFFISEDHTKNYENVVNNIGLEKLIPHIPFTKEQIQNALSSGDTALNSLSIKEWNKATGIRAHNTASPEIIYDWFFKLVNPFGVTCISQSEVVCTLKQAAIMWIKET